MNKEAITMNEEVILVDVHDRPIGHMQKKEAHKTGALHRAISVFIFNSKNELLIQQRAIHKYHSAGLWSNTCCSNPLPHESTKDAAKRRLMEEMGIVTKLDRIFSFRYSADFENGLIENEFEHVYYGISDEEPVINKYEVMDYRYISIPELLQAMKTHPHLFTKWFMLSITNVIEYNKIVALEPAVA